MRLTLCVMNLTKKQLAEMLIELQSRTRSNAKIILESVSFGTISSLI